MTKEEEKPPIHLKMKVGNVEFEIDCREDQLEDAVARILSSVREHAKEAVVISERTVPSARAETCKGVITRLWQEGWFATRRSLGDVHSEMARRGFHYDRTAVAHALIDLVKDNILTRDGKPRRYRYAQKRPPTIK